MFLDSNSALTKSLHAKNNKKTLSYSSFLVFFLFLHYGDAEAEKRIE